MVQKSLKFRVFSLLFHCYYCFIASLFKKCLPRWIFVFIFTPLFNGIILRGELFYVHCSLFTSYCLLHTAPFIVHCRLPTVDCLLFYCISIYFNLFLNFWFIVHCLSSLFTVHRLLFTVHCLPFTVYRLLFTVYRLPFTVYRVFLLCTLYFVYCSLRNTNYTNVRIYYVFLCISVFLLFYVCCL